MNKRELFILSIGIFFTVVAWVIADFFHISTQTKTKARIRVPTENKYDINSKILKILDEKIE